MNKLVKLASNRDHLITFGIVAAIFLVGAFLRLFNFPHVPYGLNQDEMNAGYEAWALLNFGTDRWGEAWPVYFLSWGSGQNVLYSYYLIPFVAVFGPTDFTVRLGMVVVGILLPLVVFFLTKLWFNKPAAYVAMGITAIFPELVKGSRWAVESNFVPFLVALGLLCFSLALLAKKPKIIFIILSLIPLALLPYAYVITAIPVGLTVIMVIWWKRDIIALHKKSWIAALSIFAIILVPIGLFMLKTSIFNNQPFFFEDWLPFSIPAMEESRFAQISEEKTGTANPFAVIVQNFTWLLSGTYQSQIGGGMTVSHIPLILVFIAIALSFVKQTKKLVPFTIVSIWIFAALPLAFVVPLTNIRGNLFYVPSIVLVSALFVCVWSIAKSNLVKIAITAAGLGYIVYVGVWYYTYQTTSIEFFYKDIRTAVETVELDNAEKLPVVLDRGSNKIEIPHTQIMWLTMMPPADIAENSRPKLKLDNYYFDLNALPEGSEYYDVVNTRFNSGCFYSDGNGTLLYEGKDWAAYKCEPLTDDRILPEPDVDLYK